jgi:acyl-CoA thioesterase I
MSRLIFTIACAAIISAGKCSLSVQAAEPGLTIVAFGDSLTAGYGLPVNEAFPAQLERTLAAKGYIVRVVNAGVSGNTVADGVARLDWSIPDETNAVIVELGANDALRGIDPEIIKAGLEAILDQLQRRQIAILLAGMRAPPNLGPEYVHSFDAIFPELAARFSAALYPFFLDGVAGRKDLNQPDGIHPTAAGIELIVVRILPKVEELIARAKLEQR